MVKETNTNNTNNNNGNNTNNTNGNNIESEIENNFDKGLKTIRLNNVLVVIRGLVSLLLEMDFICNMDQFLLTSKVRTYTSPEFFRLDLEQLINNRGFHRVFQIKKRS